MPNHENGLVVINYDSPVVIALGDGHNDRVEDRSRGSNVITLGDGHYDFVSLIYASSTVPLERRVSLHVQAASVDAALRDALRETDAEPRATASGQVMLVKRSARPASERSERVMVGSISGRVVDSATRSGVIRATVSVDGVRRTTSDDDGRYRFADVSPGGHVVEADGASPC